MTCGLCYIDVLSLHNTASSLNDDFSWVDWSDIINKENEFSADEIKLLLDDQSML